MLTMFYSKTIGQAKNAHTWVTQNIFATANKDSGDARKFI